MFLNFVCSEEKKANFREYLESHGVIEEITRIFDKIILATEKPENPIDFIRQELGHTQITQQYHDDLELQLEETYREADLLRKLIIDKGFGKLLEDGCDQGGPSSAEY